MFLFIKKKKRKKKKDRKGNTCPGKRVLTTYSTKSPAFLETNQMNKQINKRN